MVVLCCRVDSRRIYRCEAMTTSRHLSWDGTWNARDLGGLPTRGGMTKPGALVRSEQLTEMTDEGWSDLARHGVRTLIDLRNGHQISPGEQDPPPSVVITSIPIEEGLEEDDEFAEWMQDGWLGTPLYYGRFVERWPDRCARAVGSVADAQPGGVVVTCGKGSDRTGLVVALILDLLGVDRDLIVEDYLQTAMRLQSVRARALGRADDGDKIRAVLDLVGTTASVSMSEFISSVDTAALLSEGGLSTEQSTRLSQRLTS